MKYKIGISGDLINELGQPCFGNKPLIRLNERPDIEIEWMDSNIAELNQDLTSKYDAILLNLPRANRMCVQRDDCRLKIISRFGVGFDSVDIEAMKEKNIIVTNTPNAVRRPVAVASLTFIFALSGRLFMKDDLVRSNRWKERTNFMGQGLTKKTLGIVGCGSIGSELIRLSKNFFNQIVSYDPYVLETEMKIKGANKVQLLELASESDFVVVLCNLNKETFGLIDKKFLNNMKKEAFIINMSRGPVINENDLIEALENHRIEGAGLDVFNKEPIEINNKLLSLDNTILTPHALCWTDEWFSDIADEAIQSILDFIDKKEIKNKVN